MRITALLPQLSKIRSDSTCGLSLDCSGTDLFVWGYMLLTCCTWRGACEVESDPSIYRDCFPPAECVVCELAVLLGLASCLLVACFCAYLATAGSSKPAFPRRKIDRTGIRILQAHQAWLGMEGVVGNPSNLQACKRFSHWARICHLPF